MAAEGHSEVERWALNIGSGLLLLLMGILAREVYSIQGTRCTATECKAIEERLRAIEARVPAQIPPDWFRRTVEKLDERIDRLEDSNR